MITRFKIYESMGIKVGDEVVALVNRYAEKSYWVHEGEKYEVTEIIRDKIRVRDIARNKEFITLFYPRDFITVEEWEAKKYNI